MGNVLRNKYTVLKVYCDSVPSDTLEISLLTAANKNGVIRLDITEGGKSSKFQMNMDGETRKKVIDALQNIEANLLILNN